MKNSIEVALRNKHTLSIEKAGSVMKSNLEEIERMSHTIDFLLAFSILGDSKKALSLQPVSLKEVAEEVIASIRKQYGTANINLTVSDSSGAGRVCGDPVALNTLLFNLVQNAVIHTPPGGTITISIIQNGPYIEMAVADTGNGIHKADLPYIFEPFYRGVSDTRSSGSMGLGLSLVKEIASVHRASVRVASIKDTGTTFTISFHI